MASKQPNPELSRRDVLRGAATAGAGAVTLRAADDLGLDLVRDADAYVLTSAGAIFEGVQSVASVFLRDADGPSPETAATDAAKADLKADLYAAALKRHKQNESRFLNTQDIADLSKDTAYEQGKLAAFEPLSNGATEQEVVDAAHQSVTDYFKIPKKNYMDAFEATAIEVDNFMSEVKSQGYAQTDFINFPLPDVQWNGLYDYVQQFPDGTNYTTTEISIGGSDKRLAAPSAGSTTGYSNVTILGPNANVSIFSNTEWPNGYQYMQDVESNVKSGLSTWVNTVYGNLQAGEITLSRVASNLDLAQKALEDEDVPRAKADLLAMNLPTDLNRAVTVSFSRGGADWTATGMFAALSENPPAWEVGTTYDPANSGTPEVILATDGDSMSGDWSSYQTTVDGGIAVLTSEPSLGMVYQIETTAGETASANASDFAENANGNWEFDFSSQLENPITELSGVTLYPTSSTSAQIVLDGAFTIEKILDQETGEAFTTTETQRTWEPQRDDNYVTADEFEQLQKDREQQYQELLELFKEVEASGGSSGGNWWDNPFPDLPPARTLAFAAGGTIAGLLGINAATS